MAYWILNSIAPRAAAQAIVEVKDTVHFCSRCFNYAEDDLCEICRSTSRNQQLLCVVSEPRYPAHRAHGRVPGRVPRAGGRPVAYMDGIGPDDLRIPQLMQRLGSEDIREVVLAATPMWKGDHGRLSCAPDQAPGYQVTRLPAACPWAATWVCRRGDAQDGRLRQGACRSAVFVACVSRSAKTRGNEPGSAAEQLGGARMFCLMAVFLA